MCLSKNDDISGENLDPKIRDFYSSYANGMENHQNRVDCHMFKAVFKKLVSRLALVSKELRSSENTVSS